MSESSERLTDRRLHEIRYDDARYITVHGVALDRRQLLYEMDRIKKLFDEYRKAVPLCEKHAPTGVCRRTFPEEDTRKGNHMIQIRKSLVARFSRLNLSRSGAGVSTGFRGLRLGAGPAGPYLSAGLRGIFFRHSLSSPAKTKPADGEEETLSTTASIIFMTVVIVAVCSVFGIIVGILMLAIIV